MTPDRYKDVNDCLKAGVKPEALQACLVNAMDFAPERVVAAADFLEEFLREWFEKSLSEGLELPWEFPFRIRMGELTIWTGIEKSGKSTVLGFVLVGLLAQGERALVASMEVMAAKSLKKWSRQAWGGMLFDKRILEKAERAGDAAAMAHYRAQAEVEARECFAWLSKNLWMYDHVGIVHWRDLMDDMRWARRRFGITQFVIDNFMRLGIAKDDYAQQADCITALSALTMELGVHIHVVVHQNKSEGGKGGSGGKRTVSGAFEIIANAHNIVEVQRDEKKGQQVSDLFEGLKIGRIGEDQFKQEKAGLDLVPDGKFILHAQRDGDVQNGSKYLWFLWESQQYADVPPGNPQNRPIKFVKLAGRAAAQAQAKELPTEDDVKW